MLPGVKFFTAKSGEEKIKLDVRWYAVG